MKIVFAFLLSVIIFTGCSSNGDVNNDSGGDLPTKERVYNEAWNGEAIIVEKQAANGSYEVTNEITDADQVDTLIEILKNAEWEENVLVDIEPPDYQFIWNSYKYELWHNKLYNRLELVIEGQLNYGRLARQDFEIVYNILIGNELKSE